MGQQRRLGMIGCGQMGEALLRGILAAKLIPPSQIIVFDPVADRLDLMTRQYGVAGGADNRQVAEKVDLLVLAVKPQVAGDVLTELHGAVHARTLVISVMTGLRLVRVEAELGGAPRVVRAVPNTPVVVGGGVTALARGAHASTHDLEAARELFDAVGTTFVVDERLLDAVTGLSGSGPAYVCVMIDALADGGVKVGLPRDMALRLAAQMVAGSARMVLETGEHPGRLKDRVASPGGTTIAGLHELEAGGVRAALINAVEAATRRAAELGKGGK
jgi:pyrroline-5-carboxylate reductase